MLKPMLQLELKVKLKLKLEEVELVAQTSLTGNQSEDLLKAAEELQAQKFTSAKDVVLALIPLLEKQGITPPKSGCRWMRKTG